MLNATFATGDSPVMLRLATLALLLSAAVSFAGPAHADDWSVCKDENTSADTSIDACTRIIKAGRTKGNDLAVAYYNRAISFRQKKDNDSALADYNESIRIN